MTNSTEDIERPAWFSRLEIRNQEHFDETEAFAKKSGKLENFYRNLSKLCYGDRTDEELTVWGKRAAARIDLIPDFSKHSFLFSVEVQYAGEKEWSRQYNGGLIFHGPHDNGGDGSAPTFSVNMSPTDGWSVHT